MNSPFLMTGSTCYVQPAGEPVDKNPNSPASIVQAELGKIEDLLNSGKFDSVPGIDNLRSELLKVERMEAMSEA